MWRLVSNNTHDNFTHSFHPRDSAASWVHHDRLWLAGGWFNSFEQPPRDVWSFGGSGAWSLETQTAAWDHSDFAATATHGGRMLHIGGWRGGRLPDASASGSVFASVDGIRWDEIVGSAPWQAREGGAALAWAGRVWLLGGATQYYYAKKVAPGATQLLNDVWSSADGVEWELATKAAAWSPRAYFGAVGFKGRMWVYGGGNYQTGGGQGTGEPPTGYEVHNDVWSSADGSSWDLVSPSAPWKPRIWHGYAVYRARLWVLGGWAMPNHNGTPPVGNFNANDVWSSEDGAEWTRMATPPWTRRHAPCTQVFRDKLWLFAGNDWGNPAFHGTVDEVWSLELPAK